MLRKIVRSKITWSVLTLFAIALVAFVYWFAPHKLFIDTTVEEAAPTVAVPAAAPGTAAPSAPAGPQVLARGEFISHEHATTGTVVLLQLPDGNRVVRLENLDTSDGPVLAWLYVMDAFEGGLPSARYLGVMADAAESAGAPADYVQDIRLREARNVGPGPGPIDS